MLLFHHPYLLEYSNDQVMTLLEVKDEFLKKCYLDIHLGGMRDQAKPNQHFVFDLFVIASDLKWALKYSGNIQ